MKIRSIAFLVAGLAAVAATLISLASTAAPDPARPDPAQPPVEIDVEQAVDFPNDI